MFIFLLFLYSTCKYGAALLNPSMLVFFGNLIFWVERVVERFWEGTRQPPGKSPQLPLDPAAPLRGVGAGWGVAEVGVVEEEEEGEEEKEEREEAAATGLCST